MEKDNHIYRFKLANLQARNRSINVKSVYLNCKHKKKLTVYKDKHRSEIKYEKKFLIVDEKNEIDIFNQKEMNKYDFLLCLGVKGIGKETFVRLRDGYHPKLIGICPAFGTRRNIRLVFGSFDESLMDYYDSLDEKRFNKILKRLNINNYQPQWQIKKEGKILVSPNRMQGWYKDRFTIATFMDMWSVIKKLTPLKFEISLHRLDHTLIKNNLKFGERVKNFLKNTQITLLDDDEEKDFDNYYAIIADMTSVQFTAILHNTLPFNLLDDTTKCPMADLVIKDLSKLNPNNLKDTDLKDRNRWLRKMMSGFIFEDEIHNGYFIEVIFKNYLAKSLS